jgi:hypothetical protein
MASIKLTGDTSGEITISAPAVAGTNTLTLPATTGTILDSNSTLSSSNLSGALPAIDGSALTGISGDVIASSIGTSNNTNGYIRFSNNLLINWVRKSSTGTQTINWSLAFTNFYGCYVSGESTGSGFLRIHSAGVGSVTVGNANQNITGWVLAFGRKT